MRMNKGNMFLGGFFIALTRFALMPIIAAALIVVGLFTDILATWIGVGFLAMYILLCIVFGARVAAAADNAVEESEE